MLSTANHFIARHSERYCIMVFSWPNFGGEVTALCHRCDRWNEPTVTTLNDFAPGNISAGFTLHLSLARAFFAARGNDAFYS